MDEVHLEQLEDQEDKVRQDQRASLAVLVDPGNKVGREDLDFLDQLGFQDRLVDLDLLELQVYPEDRVQQDHKVFLEVQVSLEQLVVLVALVQQDFLEDLDYVDFQEDLDSKEIQGHLVSPDPKELLVSD